MPTIDEFMAGRRDKDKEKENQQQNQQQNTGGGLTVDQFMAQRTGQQEKPKQTAVDLLVPRTAASMQDSSAYWSMHPDEARNVENKARADAAAAQYQRTAGEHLMTGETVNPNRGFHFGVKRDPLGLEQSTAEPNPNARQFERDELDRLLYARDRNQTVTLNDGTIVLPDEIDALLADARTSSPDKMQAATVLRNSRQDSAAMANYQRAKGHLDDAKQEYGRLLEEQTKNGTTPELEAKIAEAEQNYKAEQAKEQAAFNRMSVGEQNKEKNPIGTILKTGTQEGLARLGYGASTLFDAVFGKDGLIGGLAQEAGGMFGDGINNLLKRDVIDADAIRRGDWNPVTKYHEKATDVMNQVTGYTQEQKGGDPLMNLGSDVTQNVVQMLPFFFLQAYTAATGAGAYTPGAANTAGGMRYVANLNTSSSTLQQSNIMFRHAADMMMRDPASQYTFTQSFATSYGDAKQDGADNAHAITYALLNATINTIIEMGGGIEQLPKELQEAAAAGEKGIWAMADAVLDESKEEVLQGSFERGLKSIYQQVELYSNENPDAMINPTVMGNEAIMAALGTIAQIPVQRGIGKLFNGVAVSRENAKTDAQVRVFSMLDSAANLENEAESDARTLAALQEIAADKKLSAAFKTLYKTDADTALEQFGAMTEEQASTSPQEAAGSVSPSEGTEIAETPAEAPTQAPPVLNSEQEQTAPKVGADALAEALRMGGKNGENITAPSQQNIDNTANPTYNGNENTAGGNTNVEGRSAEEAGGVPAGTVEGPGATRGQPRGNSELAGVVLLSQENADKIRGRTKPNGSSGVVVELHDGSADMAAFSSALDAAKAADQKNGWAVDAKTVEQLQKDGANVYITDDGSAGFAVNADGDITAVFSNKSAGAPKGTTDSMIPQAIAAGGNKLDCFGPVLAKIYAQHGFIPVARVQFDAEYAKDNIPGWTPEKGEPPIYFMMHNGDSVDTVVDNFGKYHIPTAEELDALPAMDYDEAYAYRDNLLAKQNDGKSSDSGSGSTEERGLVPAGQTEPAVQSEEQAATAEPGSGVPSTESTAPAKDNAGKKRSKTESHTEQHIAGKLGGEQSEVYYVPKSERESLTNAINRAKSDFNGEMQRLADKPMWNGEDIDTALTIYGFLQMDGVRTGDFTAAQAWGRLVSARGTESGRALQAFSKWTRSGAAAATQSMEALLEAKNLTEERKTQITNDIYNFAEEYDSIEDGDLGRIRDLIKRQAKYRNTWTFFGKEFDRMLNEVEDFDWLKEYAMRQMMNMAADFTEDADLGQKVKTWQVNAQLSRLGTFFRNIGGNGVFGVQDTLSQDFFGVALDALVGKMTGKRTLALDKSWLSSEARKGARQGMVRSILEVAGDVDMGEGGSKYGQGANRTFKMTGNKFDRMMSRWEQLLGYSLTTSDRTFRGGIEAEQMRGLSQFENLTEQERQELAQNMADYRLFQNKGMAYQAAKGLHDLANLIAGFGGKTGKGIFGRQGGFGLGDALMPYPGVPANLGVKALEYSPANLVKGIAELVKIRNDIKSGNFSVKQQQNAVMDIARGLHGSLLIAGLAALFKAGIFRNADDEDDLDAKALAKAEGRSGVQINLSAAKRWAEGGSRDWQKGDDLMKLDWLEPMNAFFAIASMAADANDLPSYADATFEGTLQSILDMPVMETVSNIFDNYRYSKGETVKEKMKDVAIGAGTDALTGMLPAPISQTARAMDRYQRDTVGDSSLDTAWRRINNAIPGNWFGKVGRETLPEKLDNFGRPIKQAESAYDRWMNSFVRPGQISDYKAEDVDRALDEFAERTGDDKVYPNRKAPNSFGTGDDKIEMTGEEKRLYQEVYGQTAEELYKSILLSDDYKDLSDGEKQWLLEEARSYANYRAQQEIRDGRNQPKDSDWDKPQSVFDTGVDPVDYLLGKKNANRDGKDSLKQAEALEWLLGSHWTDEQKEAAWSVNNNGSTKTWAEASEGFANIRKEDLPDYFDTKADVEQAIKDKNYDAVDALLDGMKSKDQSVKDKLYQDVSRLDDREAAKRAGVKTETWETVYAKYKEINNAEGNATSKTMKFDQYLDSVKGLSSAQKNVLKNQFKYYYQQEAKAEKYDKLKPLLGDENAERTYTDMKGLTKQNDKILALNNLKYLSESEKWAALEYYVSDSCWKKAQAARKAGKSFDQWVKEYTKSK